MRRPSLSARREGRSASRAPTAVPAPLASIFANCGRGGLSLAQVAKSAGISVGFLSALERSHMSASVGTLRKLARFYKTNILDFFDASAPAAAGASTRKRKVSMPVPAFAWNCWRGATP